MIKLPLTKSSLFNTADMYCMCQTMPANSILDYLFNLKLYPCSPYISCVY